MCSQAQGESREKKNNSFDYPLQQRTVNVIIMYTNNDHRKSFKCDNIIFVVRPKCLVASTGYDKLLCHSGKV